MQVGDRLYCVSQDTRRKPYWVVVQSIGWKYAKCLHEHDDKLWGEVKIRLDSMYVKSDLGYGVRAYRSVEEYQQEVEAEKAWSGLRYRSRPKHVTAEKIREFLKEPSNDATQ